MTGRALLLWSGMVAFADTYKPEAPSRPSSFGYGAAVAVEDDGAVADGLLSAFEVCSGEQGRATFTGYIADNETGLCYARNRMYSPSLGSYISRNQHGKAMGWKFTESTYDYCVVDLRLVDDGDVDDDYIDGYSFYLSPAIVQGLDPSGEPVTITFTDGTSKDINTGSGQGDAKQAAADISAAGNGTIASVDIYGHGNKNEQLFSDNNTQTQGGMTVKPDPATGGDKFPVTWAPPGFDMGKELDRALAPNGKVGLNGCTTGSGKDSIAERLSRRLGKGRKVSGFLTKRWHGPDYKKTEAAKGQKCQSAEYENGVQGPTTDYPDLGHASLN